MEEHTLNQTLALGEWKLGPALRQLMDQYRTISGFRHHGGEVISSSVPGNLLDFLEVIDHNSYAGFAFLFGEIHPLDSRSNSLIVHGFGFGSFREKVVRLLYQQAVSHLGIDEQNTFSAGNGNERNFAVWTPGN